MAKPFKDPNGPHLRVYHSLLKTVAWVELSKISKWLFYELRLTCGITNNGDISATLLDLKPRGLGSSATLSKALLELQALGFIAQTRSGGVMMGEKVCCLYRFTDLDMNEFPRHGIKALRATHDYRKFKTINECKEAIENAKIIRKIKYAKDMAHKKSTVQKVKRHSSNNEAVKAVYASKNEVEGCSTVQNMKQRNSAENLPEILAGTVSTSIRHVDFSISSTASKNEHLNRLATHGGEIAAAVSAPRRRFVASAASEIKVAA
jgi:hypothetical protein